MNRASVARIEGHDALGGTATVVPLPTHAHARACTTLETVCGQAGSLLSLALAPRGLDVAVGGVRVFDRLETTAIGADELVLAVGVPGSAQELVDLIQITALAGGAGIVLRSSEAVADRALRAAATAGVALVRASCDVDWGDIHALVRASVAAARSRSSSDGLAPGAEDLFVLADSCAALAGGFVVIEDQHLRVLSFSREQPGGADADFSAALGTPGPVARELHARGTLADVVADGDVVELDLPGLGRRRVIAVTAGGVALGFVWLVPARGPLLDGADAVLREAARLAAPQMLRRRLVGDVEREVRGEALRLLLEGAPAADVFAAQLGLPRTAVCTVVAYAAPAAGRELLSMLGPRMSDLLAMHFQSFRRDAHVVRQGEHVYALLWESTGGDRDALLHVVRESVPTIERTLKVAMHAAVGATVSGVEAIGEARRTADEALRVATSRPEERVVDIEQVRGESLLIELREFVADRPRPLSRQLQRLHEQDTDHRTDYIRTLRTYFDSFGNSSIAAELLHIHPNTLRYRLRRISDLAGVDLERAEERFALECELRLLLRDG
jgi:hypothetical protein